MRNLIRKILKEDFDWAQEAKINWSTYYNEILENVQGLPEKSEDVTEELLTPIWMKLDVLSRETRQNTKLESHRLIDEVWYEFRHIFEKVGNGTLTQKSYDTTKNILIPLITQLRGRLMSIDESMDWIVDVKPEIDFRNLEGQPFVIEWKDGRVVDRGWRIGKVIEKNGKEYILIKGNKNEPWTRWKLILAFQGKMKKYKFKFKDEEIQRNWTLKEDFDWTSQADITPNYQGHPQGVVHLRTHDEITEFFDLIDGTYGIIGKRKNELEKTKRDFHNAFDETRDRFESDDWGGHSNWIPTISASFFISKKDPTKYDTGYWDYDVEEDSVEDWLTNEGCEHEVIDCDNWKIYTDISQLRTLFNDYTGEALHKTKSGKPIKVGDKVKVVDPHSEQYGEVLEVEHLVGGDGYEKHGGAFQTIEFDTLYFAGHEVEHIEDLNEDFDWTESVPNPGKYDIFDLDILIMMNNLKIGDRIHLKGHAKDIDIIFNHVGTIHNVKRENSVYDEETVECTISIRFDDPNLLHGRGFSGSSINEYELGDHYADQEELTFDIIKKG